MKYFNKVKNIQFTEKNVPWFLLTACILAFGLLIPQLGYYQDDWNYVFNSYAFGPKGLIDFLNYDGRPVASWVYILGFAILGYKPLFWHIAILVLRWLTATVIWKILDFIWPNSNWQNLAAALLFTLYPFFTLQPLAVAYSLHWTGYLLYALSIFFMLLAFKQRFWIFTFLALITQLLHLFTLEFYSGIDLIRPILIWFVLSTTSQTTREKFITTLRKWAPYLAVFIFFFVWRGFFYQAAAEGRNTPLLFASLLNNPLATTLSTVNNALSDLVLILITSWYKLIEPENFDFSKSVNVYILITSLISFGIFYFFFSRQKSQEPTEGKSEHTGKQFFIVGVIALILSLLPAYAAGYVIHVKIPPWNSRFSLGSLFGAALIITSLIDYVIKVPKTRWIVLSIVAGLLVGWHQHSTNDFRWAWDKQVNFYRQLYLRAPEIKPDTAIIAEEELLGFMGDYPTSYGINSIYVQKGSGFENTRKADYWFFSLPEFSRKFYQYLAGEPFADERAGIVFQEEGNGSVVITFAPEQGQCLWVIRPEDANAKALPNTTRQLAQISFIDRIQQAQQNPDSFLFKYLYTNPEQDWCYYYEKADLASQYGEWNHVVQFWENASKAGLQPENGFEYIPFIKAYGQTGNWGTAKKLTRASQRTMQGIDPLLCHVWSEIEQEAPNSTEKEKTVLAVREDLSCEQE